MAEFYSASSGTIPPLPWQTFPPPFSSVLPLGKRERRRAMVLQIFVDDSGSEPQAPYFVLAGFVAPPLPNWFDFSQRWQEVLDRPPRLDYFKMVEATNLSGQFDRARGWTENSRDDRVVGFAQVIRQFANLRVSVAIKNKDFEKYIKSMAFPTRQLVSDSPYQLLFTQLVMGVAGLTSVFEPTETCRFVFDRQVGFDTEIMLTWPWFKNIAATRTSTNFAPFIQAPPVFEDDKAFLPLQAADMYAWQVRNHLVRNSKIIAPPTAVMRVLAQITPHDVDITESMLKELAGYLRDYGQWVSQQHPDWTFVHDDKKARTKARRQRKRIIGI